jgi:hypothetical protein
MVCFQTKNHNLGKFWRVLQWKMLVYFMSIWSILCPFGLFYVHLVYFTAIWSILRPLEIFYGRLVYSVAIWYIFPRFGILYQKKSGNPGANSVLTLWFGERRQFCLEFCFPPPHFSSFGRQLISLGNSLTFRNSCVCVVICKHGQMRFASNIKV